MIRQGGVQKAEVRSGGRNDEPTEPTAAPSSTRSVGVLIKLSLGGKNMVFLNRLKKVDQPGELEIEYVERRRRIAQEVRTMREQLAAERTRIESLSQRQERLTHELDAVQQDLQVAVADKNRALAAYAIGTLTEADLAPARDRVALLQNRERELSELSDAVYRQHAEATREYPQSKQIQLTNNLQHTERVFWGAICDQLRHMPSVEEDFRISLHQYWAAYQASGRGNLNLMCQELLIDTSPARAEQIRREMEPQFIND